MHTRGYCRQMPGWLNAWRIASAFGLLLVLCAVTLGDVAVAGPMLVGVNRGLPQTLSTAQSVPTGFKPVAPNEINRSFRGRRPHAEHLSPAKLAERIAVLRLNVGGNPQWSPANNPNSTLEYRLGETVGADITPGMMDFEVSKNHGSVDVSFQPVPGALYVLDCSVWAMPNQPIWVISNIADGSTAIKGQMSAPDGHLIIPFLRTPTTATGRGYAMFWGGEFDFQGCQLNVAQ